MSQTSNLIWFACDEHVDIVIDEIVDHHGLAPDLEQIAPENSQKSCSWCGHPPHYQLELTETDEHDQREK